MSAYHPGLANETASYPFSTQCAMEKLCQPCFCHSQSEDLHGFRPNDDSFKYFLN